MAMFLLVPLAALAFSLSSPATVIALKSLSVPLVVAARCALAAVALLPAVLLSRPSPDAQRFGPGKLALAMGAGVALALHLALFVAGLAHTSYAAAVALVALEPVAVLVAGIVCFGIAPSLMQLAGTGLAIAGSLVIGFGEGGGAPGAGLHPHHWSGDLMALSAVVLYGVYYALNRFLADPGRAKAEQPSSLVSACVVYSAATTTAAALTLPDLIGVHLWERGAWIFSFSGIAVTRELVLALLVLGLVPTLIGHTAAQIAARRLAPAVAGLIAPGETLGSLLIGVFAFGARPSPSEFLGAALIVTGALTVVMGKASLAAYAENLHKSR